MVNIDGKELSVEEAREYLNQKEAEEYKAKLEEHKQGEFTRVRGIVEDHLMMVRVTLTDDGRKGLFCCLSQEKIKGKCLESSDTAILLCAVQEVLGNRYVRELNDKAIERYTVNLIKPAGKELLDFVTNLIISQQLNHGERYYGTRDNMSIAIKNYDFVNIENWYGDLFEDPLKEEKLDIPSGDWVAFGIYPILRDMIP